MRNTTQGGQFGDTYSVCSTACPGSGQTQATQQPVDTLPNAPLTPYYVKANSLV
jgi:hypothetical protein